MNFFVNLFKNSRRFYVLSLTSRLIGLCGAGLFYLIYSPLWVFSFFFSSIVADIFLFKIFKLKESTYKNPDLFKDDVNFSLEKFDAYTKTMTNARIITFIGATFLGIGIFVGDFSISIGLKMGAFIYMVCMFVIFIALANKYKLPKDYVNTDYRPSEWSTSKDVTPQYYSIGGGRYFLNGCMMGSTYHNDKPYYDYS